MLAEPRREDPSSLLGVELRGFTIEALLGRGASSWVYRARHVRSRRAVALKLLTLEAVRGEDMVERMRREATLLARIRARHVVEVVDFGVTPDARPFLVMELLEGRTLAQLVADEAPVSPARFYAVARQLAEGLQAAHALGVVHRDLKPSNVMLVPSTDGEVVKLFDFGVARVALTTGNLDANRRSELSMTGEDMILGTPKYMAPEQFLSSRASQPTADLYGLGVIYYELLSGRTPFDGPLVTLLEDHLFRAPPALESHTGFEALVLALLQKRPEDRPPDAASVVDALDTIWEQAHAEPSFPSSPEAARIARGASSLPREIATSLLEQPRLEPSPTAQALLEDMLGEETRRVPEPHVSLAKKPSVRVSSSFAELSAARETRAAEHVEAEDEDRLLRPALVASPASVVIQVDQGGRTDVDASDVDGPTATLELLSHAESTATSGVTQVAEVVDLSRAGGIRLHAPDLPGAASEPLEPITNHTEIDWNKQVLRDTLLDGHLTPLEVPLPGRTTPDQRFASTMTDTPRGALDDGPPLVPSIAAAIQMPLVSQETVARDPALAPAASAPAALAGAEVREAPAEITRTLTGPRPERGFEVSRQASVVVRPVHTDELPARASMSPGGPVPSLAGPIPIARPRGDGRSVREDPRGARDDLRPRRASIEGRAPAIEVRTSDRPVVERVARPRDGIGLDEPPPPSAERAPAAEGDHAIWVGRDPRDTLPPNKIAWSGRPDGAPEKVRPLRSEPPPPGATPKPKKKAQLETLALAFLVGAALALLVLAGLLVLRNEGIPSRDTSPVVVPDEP